jgi:hypothetical protein
MNHPVRDPSLAVKSRRERPNRPGVPGWAYIDNSGATDR